MSAMSVGDTDVFVHSQAPARVDLAGGTLDIWPLYLYHENSQTVNFAINLYARCRLTPRRARQIEIISRDLRRRESFASYEALKQAAARGKLRLPLAALLIREFAPEQGLTLEMESGVPAGSGLGGSSALNIAICGALARLTKRRFSRGKLIEMARNVESQVLGVPAGEQDYFSAMNGGVQAIHWTAHGNEAERLPIPAAEINARFLLCYTGQSRHSGTNNWEVMKAHIDGRRAVIRHFDRIAAIAAELRHALTEKDWTATARLVSADWAARKKVWPGITTPQIDALIRAAMRSGAWAGKACGAGGGGCVVFLMEPEARQDVERAVSRLGVRLLPAQLASRGLQVRAGTR